MSRFNAAVFATTNEAERVVTLSGGRTIVVNRDGRTASDPLTDDERRAVLVDRFGYSEAIVTVLPPDDAAVENPPADSA